VALADWPIVRHHAHPGYLSWEQFLRNQQRLDDNCTASGNDRRGAVRQGHALLQGLVLCGRCGRRVTVRYTRKGTTPSYECTQVHKQQGGATCQFIRGARAGTPSAKPPWAAWTSQTMAHSSMS
jgi:hypothetical protein